MITPSFSLTATERVLPKMALDFTTASLDPRVTFTRTGNTATVTNSSGVIAAINANLPRFDYDPTTLVCKGLLIEEARTNLLLNSLIDGTNLATQLVTTTAVAHTLSFYGTGQIVLTGTSSATVVGTGAYPSRKTLTFTPTAGVLTLTVTGTVQYAQLEVGVFPTSYIPTDATSKTRNADVAVMTGTNFSSWFNQTQGSAYVEYNIPYALASGAGVRVFTFLGAGGIGVDEMPMFVVQSTGKALSANAFTSSVNAGRIDSTASFVANTTLKATFAYGSNARAITANGLTTVTSTTAFTIPTCTNAGIGNSSTISQINGYIKKINYYPLKLTNAELQAFSK